MKKLLFIAVALLLTACQSPLSSMKVNSDVEGMVYNQIHNQYAPKLTVAYLSEYTDDAFLSYKVESYTYAYGAFQSINYAIPKSFAKQHKSMLEKFLAWDSKATQNKDQFTKEIGIVKTYNGYSVYTFHSGSVGKNYLQVCFSMTDTPNCSLEKITFDSKNVKRIIKDIDKLSAEKFKKTNLDNYK